MGAHHALQALGHELFGDAPPQGVEVLDLAVLDGERATALLQPVVEEAPGPVAACQCVPDLLPLLFHLPQVGRAPQVRPVGHSLEGRPLGRILPRHVRLPFFA